MPKNVMKPQSHYKGKVGPRAHEVRILGRRNKIQFRGTHREDYGEVPAAPPGLSDQWQGQPLAEDFYPIDRTIPKVTPEDTESLWFGGSGQEFLSPVNEDRAARGETPLTHATDNTPGHFTYVGDDEEIHTAEDISQVPEKNLAFIDTVNNVIVQGNPASDPRLVPYVYRGGDVQIYNGQAQRVWEDNPTMGVINPNKRYYYDDLTNTYTTEIQNSDFPIYINLETNELGLSPATGYVPFYSGEQDLFDPNLEEDELYERQVDFALQQSGVIYKLPAGYDVFRFDYTMEHGDVEVPVITRPSQVDPGITDFIQNISANGNVVGQIFFNPATNKINRYAAEGAIPLYVADDGSFTMDSSAAQSFEGANAEAQMYVYVGDIINEIVDNEQALGPVDLPTSYQGALEFQQGPEDNKFIYVDGQPIPVDLDWKPNMDIYILDDQGNPVTIDTTKTLNKFFWGSQMFDPLKKSINNDAGRYMYGETSGMGAAFLDVGARSLEWLAAKISAITTTDFGGTSDMATNMYGVGAQGRNLLGEFVAPAAIVAAGALAGDKLPSRVSLPIASGVLVNNLLSPDTMYYLKYGASDEPNATFGSFTQREYENFLASGRYTEEDFVSLDNLTARTINLHASVDHFEETMRNSIETPGGEYLFSLAQASSLAATQEGAVLPNQVVDDKQLELVENLVNQTPEFVEYNQEYINTNRELAEQSQVYLADAQEFYELGDYESASQTWRDYYDTLRKLPATGIALDSYTWKGTVNGDALYEKFLTAISEASTQHNRPLANYEIQAIKDYFEDPATEAMGEILFDPATWLGLVGVDTLSDYIMKGVMHVGKGAFIGGKYAAQGILGGAGDIFWAVSSVIKKGEADELLIRAGKTIDDSITYAMRADVLRKGSTMSNRLAAFSDYFLGVSARSGARQARSTAADYLWDTMNRAGKFDGSEEMATSIRDAINADALKFADRNSDFVTKAARESKVGTKVLENSTIIKNSATEKISAEDLFRSASGAEHVRNTAKLGAIDGLSPDDWASTFITAYTASFDNRVKILSRRNPSMDEDLIKAMAREWIGKHPYDVISRFSGIVSSSFLNAKRMYGDIFAGSLGDVFLRLTQKRDIYSDAMDKVLFDHPNWSGAELRQAAQKLAGADAYRPLMAAVVSGASKASNVARKIFAYSVLGGRPAWIVRNSIDSLYRMLKFGGTFKSLVTDYHELFASKHIPREFLTSLFAVADDAVSQERMIAELLDSNLSASYSGFELVKKKIGRRLRYSWGGLVVSKWNQMDEGLSFVQKTLQTPKSLLTAASDLNAIIEFDLRIRLFNDKVRKHISDFSMPMAIRMRRVAMEANLDEETTKTLLDLYRKYGNDMSRFNNIISNVASESKQYDVKAMRAMMIPEGMEEILGNFNDGQKEQLINSFVTKFVEAIETAEYHSKVFGEEDVSKFFNDLMSEVDTNVKEYSYAMADMRGGVPKNGEDIGKVMTGGAEATEAAADVATPQALMYDQSIGRKIQSFQDFVMEGRYPVAPKRLRPRKAADRELFSNFILSTNDKIREAGMSFHPSVLSKSKDELIKVYGTALEDYSAYLKKAGYDIVDYGASAGSVFVKPVSEAVSSEEVMSRVIRSTITEMNTPEAAVREAVSLVDGMKDVEMVVEDVAGAAIDGVRVTSKGDVIIIHADPERILDNPLDTVQQTFLEVWSHKNLKKVTKEFKGYEITAETITQILADIPYVSMSELSTKYPENLVSWIYHTAAIDKTFVSGYGSVFEVPWSTVFNSKTIDGAVFVENARFLENVKSGLPMYHLRAGRDYTGTVGRTRTALSKFKDDASLVAEIEGLEEGVRKFTDQLDLISVLNANLRKFSAEVFPGPLRQIGPARSIAWDQSNEFGTVMYNALENLVQRQMDDINLAALNKTPVTVRSITVKEIFDEIGIKMTFDSNGLLKSYSIPLLDGHHLWEASNHMKASRQFSEIFLGETFSKRFPSNIEEALENLGSHAVYEEISGRGNTIAEKYVNINRMFSGDVLSRDVADLKSELDTYAEIADILGLDVEQRDALRRTHAPLVNQFLEAAPEGTTIEDYFNALNIRAAKETGSDYGNLKVVVKDYGEVIVGLGDDDSARLTKSALMDADVSDIEVEEPLVDTMISNAEMQQVAEETEEEAAARVAAWHETLADHIALKERTDNLVESAGVIEEVEDYRRHLEDALHDVDETKLKSLEKLPDDPSAVPSGLRYEEHLRRFEEAHGYPYPFSRWDERPREDIPSYMEYLVEKYDTGPDELCSELVKIQTTLETYNLKTDGLTVDFKPPEIMIQTIFTREQRDIGFHDVREWKRMVVDSGMSVELNHDYLGMLDPAMDVQSVRGLDVEELLDPRGLDDIEVIPVDKVAKVKTVVPDIDEAKRARDLEDIMQSDMYKRLRERVDARKGTKAEVYETLSEKIEPTSPVKKNLTIATPALEYSDQDIVPRYDGTPVIYARLGISDITGHSVVAEFDNKPIVLGKSKSYTVMTTETQTPVRVVGEVREFRSNVRKVMRGNDKMDVGMQMVYKDIQDAINSGQEYVVLPNVDFLLAQKGGTNYVTATRLPGDTFELRYGTVDISRNREAAFSLDVDRLTRSAQSQRGTLRSGVEHGIAENGDVHFKYGKRTIVLPAGQDRVTVMRQVDNALNRYDRNIKPVYEKLQEQFPEHLLDEMRIQINVGQSIVNVPVIRLSPEFIHEFQRTTPRKQVGKYTYTSLVDSITNSKFGFPEELVLDSKAPYSIETAIRSALAQTGVAKADVDSLDFDLLMKDLPVFEVDGSYRISAEHLVESMTRQTLSLDAHSVSSALGIPTVQFKVRASGESILSELGVGKLDIGELPTRRGTYLVMPTPSFVSGMQSSDYLNSSVQAANAVYVDSAINFVKASGGNGVVVPSLDEFLDLTMWDPEGVTELPKMLAYNDFANKRYVFNISTGRGSKSYRAESFNKLFNDYPEALARSSVYQTIPYELVDGAPVFDETALGQFLDDFGYQFGYVKRDLGDFLGVDSEDFEALAVGLMKRMEDTTEPIVFSDAEIFLTETYADFLEKLSTHKAVGNPGGFVDIGTAKVELFDIPQDKLLTDIWGEAGAMVSPNDFQLRNEFTGFLTNVKGMSDVDAAEVFTDPWKFEVRYMDFLSNRSQFTPAVTEFVKNSVVKYPMYPAHMHTGGVIPQMAEGPFMFFSKQSGSTKFIDDSLEGMKYLNIEKPIKFSVDVTDFSDRDMLAQAVLDSADRLFGSDEAMELITVAEDLMVAKNSSGIYNILSDYGYDSLMLADGSVAVLKPSSVMSVLGEANFNRAKRFQKSTEIVRGATYFDSELDRIVIDLYESADISTAVHELSHVWIMQMQTLADSGSRKAKATLRKIEKVVGSLESIEAEEEFAEAMEAYLMSGASVRTAPLQMAMDNMKLWMLDVYNKYDNMPTADQGLTDIFSRWFNGDTNTIDRNFADQMSTNSALASMGNDTLRRQGEAWFTDVDGVLTPVEAGLADTYTKAFQEYKAKYMSKSLDTQWKSMISSAGWKAMDKEDKMISELVRTELEWMLRDLVHHAPTVDGDLFKVAQWSPLSMSEYGSHWSAYAGPCMDYVEVVDLITKLVDGEDVPMDKARGLLNIAYEALRRGVNNPDGTLIRPANLYYMSAIEVSDDALTSLSKLWDDFGYTPESEARITLKHRSYKRYPERVLWDEYASQPWYGNQTLKSLWGEHAESADRLVAYIEQYVSTHGGDLTPGQLSALQVLQWQTKNFRSISNRVLYGTNMVAHPSLKVITEPIAPTISHLDASIKTWLFGQLDTVAPKRHEELMTFIEAWKRQAMDVYKGKPTEAAAFGNLPKSQYANMLEFSRRLNDDNDLMWDMAINGHNRDYNSALFDSTGIRLNEDGTKRITSSGLAPLEQKHIRAIELFDETRTRQNAMLDEFGLGADAHIYGALPDTQKVMVDYSHASNFDETMRHLVPFWMFPSRSVPFWINAITNDSKLFAFYQRYMSASRRVSKQEFGINSDGEQLASLRGYFPVPGTDMWINPLSPFSFVSVVNYTPTYEYEKPETDNVLEEVLMFINQKSSKYGFSFAPWLTGVAGAIAKKMNPNLEPYDMSLAAQIDLVPPWTQRAINEKLDFVKPFNERPWLDYSTEMRLLEHAYSEVMKAESDAEKEAIISEIQDFFLLDYGDREQSQRWVNALRSVDTDDYIQGLMGYFSGIYPKTYTNERAQINMLRHEINALKMSINDEAVATTLSLDLVPAHIYDMYTDRRYNDYSSQVANFASMIGWINIPDGYANMGEFAQDPELRAYFESLSVEEDMYEQARYEATNAAQEQLQRDLLQDPIGSSHEAAYAQYAETMAEIQSQFYKPISSQYYIGYKPEELVWEHFVELYMKLMEETMPRYHPEDEEWGEYEARKLGWQQEFPNIAEAMMPTYLVSVAMDLGFATDKAIEELDTAATIEAFKQEYMQGPVEIYGNRTFNLPQLLEEIQMVSNYEAYNNWNLDNDTLLNALDSAWRETYYNEYWDAISGASGSIDRRLRLAEHQRKWGDMLNNPNAQQEIISWVNETYPGRFTEDEILDQISGRGYMTTDEKLDKDPLRSNIWNEINNIPPGQSTELRDFIRENGGEESWVDLFYGTNSLDAWNDEGDASAFLSILKKFNESNYYDTPSSTTLMEWQDAQDLNDVFYSELADYFGDDIMEVMITYWNLNSSEKSEYKAEHPEIDGYYDFREVYGRSNMVWAKYYAPSVLEEDGETRVNSGGYGRFIGYGDDEFTQLAGNEIVREIRGLADQGRTLSNSSLSYIRYLKDAYPQYRSYLSAVLKLNNDLFRISLTTQSKFLPPSSVGSIQHRTSGSGSGLRQAQPPSGYREASGAYGESGVSTGNTSVNYQMRGISRTNPSPAKVTSSPTPRPQAVAQENASILESILPPEVKEAIVNMVNSGEPLPPEVQSVLVELAQANPELEGEVIKILQFSESVAEV